MLLYNAKFVAISYDSDINLIHQSKAKSYKFNFLNSFLNTHPPFMS